MSAKLDHGRVFSSIAVSCRLRFPAFFLCCSCLLSVCHAQTHGVLCTDGTGTFETAFFTKVQVRVGAARKGGFAARSCEAVLSWNEEKLVVATDIPILDLDAFGVDLGLGAPVAAFQTKKSKDDCCMTYQIYSLQKPPKLLRSLTGGSFFEAADTDLDGQVEIWTDDAAAVDGFDNLHLAKLDFAPPMVLRFEKGKLWDVSSEFASEFDRRIAALRAQLRPEDFSDFKSSDGKLESTNSSVSEQIHRLRGIKARILEIAWLYFYSGREQEAWHSLSEMWPASDVDRIREALTKARTLGIRAQLDGVSTAVPVKKKWVKIFTPTPPDTRVEYGLEGVHSMDADASRSKGPAPVVAAKPILVRTFPMVGTDDPARLEVGMTVILVIDSAGKVRSASPMGTSSSGILDLTAALSEWKLVPAFKGQHAVASSMVKILALQP